jgi:hypothetical protein
MVITIIEILNATEKLSKITISWKNEELSPQSLKERKRVTRRPAIATGARIVLFLVNPRYKIIIPSIVVNIIAFICFRRSGC